MELYKDINQSEVDTMIIFIHSCFDQIAGSNPALATVKESYLNYRSTVVMPMAKDLLKSFHLCSGIVRVKTLATKVN